MENDEKPGPGRPAYEPTPKDRANVQLLASVGTREGDIAKVVGVSQPTLRKYYATELDTGHILATARVAQSLYRMATDKDKPNVAAAIFWLKSQAGWRDIPSDNTPLGTKAEAAANARRPPPDGSGWEDLLPRHQQPVQ
jgi:hypothetical protein